MARRAAAARRRGSATTGILNGNRGLAQLEVLLTAIKLATRASAFRSIARHALATHVHAGHSAQTLIQADMDRRLAGHASYQHRPGGGRLTVTATARDGEYQKHQHQKHEYQKQQQQKQQRQRKQKAERVLGARFEANIATGGLQIRANRVSQDGKMSAFPGEAEIEAVRSAQGGICDASDLKAVLANSLGKDYFVRFTQQEMSDENLQFLEDSQAYLTASSSAIARLFQAVGALHMEIARASSTDEASRRSLTREFNEHLVKSLVDKDIYNVQSTIHIGKLQLQRGMLTNNGGQWVGTAPPTAPVGDVDKSIHRSVSASECYSAYACSCIASRDAFPLLAVVYRATGCPLEKNWMLRISLRRVGRDKISYKTRVVKRRTYTPEWNECARFSGATFGDSVEFVLQKHGLLSSVHAYCRVDLAELSSRHIIHKTLMMHKNKTSRTLSTVTLFATILIDPACLADGAVVGPGNADALPSPLLKMDASGGLRLADDTKAAPAQGGTKAPAINRTVTTLRALSPSMNRDVADI